MGKRMWRRSLNLLAILSLFLSVAISSVHAATTAQPEITLSGANQLQVGESKELIVSTANLAAETQITLSLPAGLEFDEAQFKQQADVTEEQISVHREQAELVITLHTAMAMKLSLPVIAAKAGTYQLQARTTTLQSNQQTVTVTDMQSATETTTEKNDSTATVTTPEDGSSTSVAESNNTSSSSTTTASSSATSEKEFSASTSTTPVLNSKSIIQSRASSTISLKVDQSSGTSSLLTNNYYGGDYQVSGTVWDNTAETLSFYAMMTKRDGNGATPAKEQLLGTVKVASNVQQSWQFTIPDSYLPDVNTQSAGSHYRVRIEARQTTSNFGSANFQLAYVQGNLGLTAPSMVNFGDNLSVTETEKRTFLGKIAAGDQPLAVKDTRIFPASSTINGWQLTVSLAQQMTGASTGTVLTDSLHYLNNGTDYTLSSAASPVASLQTATPGKNTVISDTWNAQNGLAFEPTPGQPKSEQYSGSVTWNLQETPANK